MPTKIRLQRKGKKGQPFYHLVIADGRAPRDGKFIEKIGTYNPMTHPATIDLDFNRALHWVQVGAQPTDTARSILSREGVMMKHHLLKGITKGALTEDQVEEKFNAWLKEKADKIEQAAKDAELSDKERKKKLLEDEKKVSDARAEALAKKYAKETAKESEKEEETVEATDEAPEAKVESPATETTEIKEEAPKAEESPKKEEETPKAEEAPKKEEAPEAKVESDVAEEKEDAPKAKADTKSTETKEEAPKDTEEAPKSEEAPESKDQEKKAE